MAGVQWQGKTGIPLNLSPTRQVVRRAITCLGLTGYVLGIAACTSPDKANISQGQAVGGLVGGVVVDEPQAAIAARNILRLGGSAADAVAAAYFTLAVTYPAAASLGGGGVCLVYDTATDETETLEFLPGRPQEAGTIAVPGNLRGMAALHARYGRKQWGEIIAPAEELARFGHSISRATGVGLPTLGEIYQGSRSSLRLFPFISIAGEGKSEGDEAVQLSLAASLGLIRSKGVTPLYGGSLGRIFVNDMQALGGTLTIDDLRSYKPVWRGTRTQDLGNLQIHSALPPPESGNIMFELMARLKDWKADASVSDLVAISRDVLRPAAADTVIIGEGPARADTAVVAGEQNGSAVACSFTMAAPFGSGHYSAGTGILAAPDSDLQNRALAPLLAVNHNVREAYLAVAAGGDVGATVAAAGIAAALLVDEVPLDRAMVAKRAYARKDLGVIAEPEAAVSDPVAEVEKFGRVSAFWCPSGLRSDPSACRYRSDNRGHGLAVGVNQSAAR